MNNLEIQNEQQSQNNDEGEQEEDSDSLHNKLLLNNIPTPSRTESNFQTSTNKSIHRKSIQQLNQLSDNMQFKLESKNQDASYNDLDLKKQTQISYNSSKSSKTQASMKISLLQASLIAKDQLILNLQEEVKQLKKHQINKDQQIIELSKNYEIKLSQMFQRITDLEKIIKEKDHDIELFKNGNNTLNLQDLSVITNKQNDTKKIKLNDLQQNESQGYRQNAELYLNSNFWLISAEKKLYGNNPVFNYQSKDVLDAKQSQFYQQQQKVSDKSYWPKQNVESNKQIKHNSNVQLPKLVEMNSQINLQQLKYYHNNLRSSSLQQNNYKNYSSMSQLNINKDVIPYDPDDFIADQEIKQIFTIQSPVKKESIDWDSQPSNKYMITQNPNLNQAKLDYIDKVQLSQNNIYQRKQNQHKLSNK
ncbi:unnamed protein product [Paramecium sonneborni]|uniref:Uncharacterized protein n=1 Tax=Paramecium sonneborni TaxID=65129 RepID=A0A8S1PUK7_9CILI|nr:unnamed protein product [Paramecium sonneborni]